MKYKDSEVLVREVIPPVGGKFCFSATVQFLVVEESGDTRRLNPELGECLGETSAEARSKMQSKLQEWVDQNVV